jgi:hypothetical protein
MALLKIDPRFDSLHDDPRFQDLMRRMNFPERTKTMVPRPVRVVIVADNH